METVNKIFKAKNELIVLAVLVPLVILLGVMIIKWPQLQTASISEEIVSTPDQTGQGVVVADTTTASIYPTPVRETVLLIIENGPKKTVVQVVAENKMTMEEKDYGESMGILIESINSVANDNGQKRYWYLYVNGQLSPVGASQAQVKAGDEVNWKYEEEKDE